MLASVHTYCTTRIYPTRFAYQTFPIPSSFHFTVRSVSSPLGFRLRVGRHGMWMFLLPWTCHQSHRVLFFTSFFFSRFLFHLPRLPFARSFVRSVWGRSGCVDGWLIISMHISALRPQSDSGQIIDYTYACPDSSRAMYPFKFKFPSPRSFIRTGI